MSEVEKKIDKKKLNKHEFYFETPLYKEVNIDDLEKEIFTGDVDAYSAKNRIDTTYAISGSRISSYVTSIYYNYFQIELKCKRRKDDSLIFIVYIDDSSLIKVGQNPSLADIQFAEIGKKYDKYLSRDDLQEYKKAIGLASYGVGAGSFVYLRRIFEKLINKTFITNKDKFSYSEEDFKRIRMSDKVDILKEFLPKQLVEMKQIYSILSDGVHDLSEQECLSYFPALKLSIEFILEEQIEAEKEALRQKEISKTIKKIATDLKKKNETNQEQENKLVL